MLRNETINKILAVEDNENGGNHALDGFEFQVSSAIYLIFNELKSEKSFKLAYEKLEDFIIFSDTVKLYQAKSISANLSPKILYKPQKKTNKNTSTLSIIEKMNSNYVSVKEAVDNIEVSSTLIICESRIFSQLLTSIPEIKAEKHFKFNDLKDDIKKEIINNTKYENYNWNDMHAVRILPKKYHEELTRTFIEDVIENILGASKVSSIALYNSLTCEIRRIRKNKLTLDDEFLINEINKYTQIDSKLEFKDYSQLLNAEDQKNIFIASSFNFYQNTIMIKNHPSFKDFDTISEVTKKNRLNTLDEYYDHIFTSQDYIELTTRLETYEIKALLLLSIAKEFKI